MIDHFIQLNKLRFHYLEWPSAADETLVLLHGFAGSALTWDVFAQALAPHYRVLALDQRGHGESEWADAYGAEHAAADLAAFVDALALPPLTLLGHSMGGRNAMLYVHRHPECVAKFVLLDTGPELSVAGGRRIMGGWQNNQDVFDSREQAFEQLRAVNQRPPLEHHRTRVYHGLKQLPDGKWTWKYDERLRRGSRESLSQPPIPSAEYWRMWSAIACPMLLVRGELSDLLTAELAARMVAANPRCTLVTIAGAGHSVPMDRPVEFEAAVRNWLGV